jgi:hypothetical protein
MAFIDEMFELIVKLLKATAGKYSDGDEAECDHKIGRVDIFDFEICIRNAEKTRLRSNNLKKFVREVVENIIMKNIDAVKIRNK